MRLRISFLLTLAFIISACSPVSQVLSPSETPRPTATLPSTPTPTLQQKITLTPEPTDEKSPELGTLVSDWQGVPVIPGANEGMPAGFGYIYSVNVTVDEAEQFYQEKMEQDGWALSNRQTSETSMYGGPATILDYERGDEAFNIMLIFSTDENYTMIMLTQLKP